MPEVKFYLKKPEPSGKSLIFLKFKYSGLVLVYAFGQKTLPKDWNKAKQRLKSNKATTEDGNHSINDLLDNLEKVCRHAYHSEIPKGVPSPDTLRKYLSNFMSQNHNDDDPQTGPTLFSLIEDFMSGKVKHRGQEKKHATLANYKTTYNHLRDFAVKERYPVTFDSINLAFYDRFIDFLRKKKLGTNTIGKYLKDIKTFMAEAVDRDLTLNHQFRKKKFVVIKEETDAVYLTEREVEKLFKHDFSDDKKLESTRDLFVAACWLGLRYSDLSNIKAENIKNISGELFIEMKTQKTGETVIIPCHQTVLKIFEKYGNNKNRLPRAISNQKYNQYIKEACKTAGLIETGRLLAHPQSPLYDLVSSHTARRSFATNYYLQGFPSMELRMITGHRTETSFMRYIKVSKLDTAKRLSMHNKKNWSEKLMKVAS